MRRYKNNIKPICYFLELELQTGVAKKIGTGRKVNENIKIAFLADITPGTETEEGNFIDMVSFLHFKQEVLQNLN